MRGERDNSVILSSSPLRDPRRNPCRSATVVEQQGSEDKPSQKSGTPFWQGCFQLAIEATDHSLAKMEKECRAQLVNQGLVMVEGAREIL